MHNALYHYRAWFPPKSKEFHVDDIPDLTGKVALVTGGATAVGFRVAKALADAKARVLVLAGKDDPDDHSDNDSNAGIVPVECDFASLADVKRVADAVCAQESRLDILVCAAAVGLQPFALSADKLDSHFAATHLAHFLLVNRLLPLLRSSAAPPGAATEGSAPRIVALSSTLHTLASPTALFLSHAELSPASACASSPLALAARAALATVLFTKSLALVLSSSSSGSREDASQGNSDSPPILVLATDPGLAHSSRPSRPAQDHPQDAFGHVVESVMARVARAPDEACLCPLWAATAPEVEDEWEVWHGAYVSAPEVMGHESSLARDEERGARLWAMSEDLVRKCLGDDALHPWIANGES